MFSYFHLFKCFPLFVMIHIVKGFSVVNEKEVDIFLGSKITADGDCSHESKRRLLLGRKGMMTNLSSVQFSRSVVSDSL